MMLVYAFMKRSLNQSLPESFKSGSKFLFFNIRSVKNLWSISNSSGTLSLLFFSMVSLSKIKLC